MFSVDEGMAELCGVISGDGNIWSNGRKYEITITGSPQNREYLDRIAAYISQHIKPKTYYRVRGRGLRLTIYSKLFFEFLVKEVKLGSGTMKNVLGMPQCIKKSQRCAIAFVRGVFDTDGSVFTSRKKGVVDYPTIEITNENRLLLLDIRKILESKGIRTTFRKCNDGTYKIAVHGKEMLVRWKAIISSSNPKKLSKMESIIKAFS